MKEPTTGEAIGAYEPPQVITYTEEELLEAIEGRGDTGFIP